MFEEYQGFLYAIVDAFALLTAFLATRMFFRVKDKTAGKLTHVLRSFLFFVSLGLIFWTFAEIGWSVLSVVFGVNPEANVPDILWFIGYFMFFVGLGKFLLYLYDSHKMVSRGILSLSFFSLAGFCAMFFLVKYVIGGAYIFDSVEVFLYYAYPMFSFVLFLWTISLCGFFKSLRNLSIPFCLLAVFFLTNVCGDVLFSYYAFAEIYGLPGVISDALYGVGYMLSSLAFYLLSE